MLQRMYLNKKTQSSFEFIILTGVVMVFLILILTLVVNRTQDFDQTKTELYTQAISESIEKEISLARSLPSGYRRYFEIPRDLEGQEFDFRIIKGKELVIRTNELLEYLSFLPQVVYGQIGPGRNKIMKQGNEIGLCFEEEENICNTPYENNSNNLCFCENIFPSGTNGTVQCLDNNLWLDCDFGYDDLYEGIKTQCLRGSPEIKNVTLNLTHIDSGIKILTTSSNEFDEFDTRDFIFTLDENLEINKSGNWNLQYTCHSNTESFNYFIDFYVPYGFYQIIPHLSGCNRESKDNYTCEENETFEISYEIRCMQGDCGDTKIWLDP